MGACVLSELEQPASQKLTSETAAIRLNVNTGLPVLIYIPRYGKTLVANRDVLSIGHR
nr:peptidase [Pantoea sp. IMH]